MYEKGSLVVAAITLQNNGWWPPVGTVGEVMNANYDLLQIKWPGIENWDIYSYNASWVEPYEYSINLDDLSKLLEG